MNHAGPCDLAGQKVPCPSRERGIFLPAGVDQGGARIFLSKAGEIDIANGSAATRVAN